MNKQSLGRIASRGILHFRVEGDVESLLKVGGAVNINMANAFTVAENRSPAMLGHEVHQFARAAWNNQIDARFEFEEFLYVSARFKKPDRIRRDCGECGETLAPNRYQDSIRMGRLRATLQDKGVA